MQKNELVNLKGDQKKAHLEALQSDQNGARPIKQKKGSVDKAYTYPAHEAHLVHVLIHEPQFNSQTGVDEGRKFVQKFDAGEYTRMVKEQAFAGKKVTVLHDPAGDAEDVAPEDVKIPAVVSQPGAGIKLDKPVSEKSYEELKADWDALYKEVPDAKRPQAKADLIEQITARVTYLADEKNGPGANS